MLLRDLPSNAGPATDEGINDALEAAFADEEEAKGLADLLEQNPRRSIRRAIRLNRYQRASLMEMSDDELRELVSPVVGALRGADPFDFRARIVEQVITESPLKIKCTIEIDF
jgi:hypothetical protein